MLNPRARPKNKNANNRDETTALLPPATSNYGGFWRTRLFLLVAAASTFWLFHTLLRNLRLKHGLGDPSKHSNPLRDNGLTTDVQWDRYSLFVKGQRVFLWSGEFHPWRLPVQSQWLDILQKIKASGMNAVSVYAHWGLHNPSRGTLDFDAWRDWQPFFDMAKAVGLWVVFRPGPYINAETTGGGIPGWVISETPGDLRNNNTEYHEAWSPYIKAISDLVRRNQVTEGGPIIAVQAENEYTNNKDEGPPYKPEMMAQLRKAFIEGGVTVPQTHNDMGMWWNYVDGTGSPDLYGFDDYPQGFDCSHPYEWHNITHAYHDYHMKAFPSSPLYIPEAQAGAFDPWGPSAPTYDQCRILTNPAFQNNLYYHMFASNAKMINLYMMYGGTSWGNIPFPGVYTSYDYGSPIRESRALSEKFEHLKLLGLFLRSVPDFYHTDVVSIDTVHAYNQGSVLVTHLQNPTTKAGFYFIRHSNIPSSETATYSLRLKTLSGELQLPLVYDHFTLKNRTTDLILTDLSFGNSRLAYTSASVLFAGTMGDRDVIVLHGHGDQAYEAVISLKGIPREITQNPRVSLVNLKHLTGNGTLVSFLPGIKGLIEVWDSGTQLVLYCDSATAATFHAPTLAGASEDPFREYWGIGTNTSVLIGGPHLVRSATFEDGKLALEGDIQGDTMLRLIGLPTSTNRITWNGMEIEAIRDVDSAPSITSGLVRQRVQTLAGIPDVLGPWKYQDSLPEIRDEFDDNNWIEATNSSTNSPYKPLFGDGPVLYACDYGFCEGAVLWRGTFDSANGVKGARLAINGGEAFAASVWVNGHFIKTTYGNSTNNMNIISETDEEYYFPEDVLFNDRPNVLVILQDNMGFDEMASHFDANASKSPRGVRGHSLLPHGSFTSWKVQGKLGGYRDFVDRHRGLLNTGGLYGERLGWHLPGYPDAEWTQRDLSDGLPEDGAGVGFFRTEFDLNIEEGWDTMMSFEFEDSTEFQPYRALLFINGWHMGKRVANLGPQYKFIVHEGILNYQGSNTVVVALWNMERGHSIGPRVKLVVDGKVDGGAGAHYEPAPSWQDVYGEFAI